MSPQRDSPQIDRQLEAGARPAEIIRGLNARKQIDERQAQDELVSRVFEQRSTQRLQEQTTAVTRDEELWALLRRTFAKLAHKGGAAIDQIQLSLGHESIQTTEDYLGVEQDLTDAPCDRLGLRLSN